MAKAKSSTKSKAPRAKGIRAEVFVPAWQKNDNAGDVAEALGKPRSAAAQMSTRASQLRNKGIPLKKYPRGGGGGGATLDIAKLTALAKSLA